MIPFKSAFLLLLLLFSNPALSQSQTSLPQSQSSLSQTFPSQSDSPSVSLSLYTISSPGFIPPPSLNASTVSTASVPLASTTSTTTSRSFVGLTGLSRSTTASTTSATRPQATNTRPCNGHVEFCSRRYSNVSVVVAHNSPFVVPHNAASNQVFTEIPQLEDGIRGLQFETHYPSADAGLRLCHTSCTLLDVGPLESYLKTVTAWLDRNPYEVITIMMGNDNRVPPGTYVAPFQNSGILRYVYTPNASTLTIDEWPTLGEMILRNKRVVVMLDYLADQKQVPWLLDQFAYQWQTPFSPTDPAFPCTQQRPPNQTEQVSRNMMYMANHNLNIEVSLLGMNILIPAYTLLNQINAATGDASLGTMSRNCTGKWNRPPNFLLVDYYNFGNFNGSVFEVAAEANGVGYQKGTCCGGKGVAGEAVRLLAVGLGVRRAWMGVLLCWVFSRPSWGLVA